MNVNFKFNSPEAKDKVYFEQIFAEKPGGGLVKNPSVDLPPTSPVGINNDGVFEACKSYRLYEAVEAADTSIKLVKGSGVAVNDILGYNGTAVKVTAVDSTANEDYDVATVTFGVDIAADTVLYQAAAESAPAGYYDAESTDEGALKVVASGATTGQINLADATPYRGSKSPLAANDYVEYREAVIAAPVLAPKFVLGAPVFAGKGDQLVKLVNGANLRKETANISAEVADLLPGISLV